MALTSVAKEKILKSRSLRLKIALEMGVIEKSVQNWVYNNSLKLETPAVIRVISCETDLKESEIISKENEAA